MNPATYALAGLGLFFTGLHLLAASMQPLASGRLRLLIAKAVEGHVSTAMAGCALGLITQSTTAAAFVGIGLMNSGVLPFQRVLALTGWSSAGTSLLVFLATADVKTAGLIAVGLVGLGHLFNAQRDALGRQLVTFLFALGVLFLGLGMVKEASTGLHESAWVIEFIEFSSEAALIGFLVGIIVTLITHSSSSVTILAVTLTSAGVLPLSDAIIVVYGSSIGSGLTLLLATSHLNAKQRQLACYQCLIKLMGVAVVWPRLWLLKNGMEHSPLMEFFSMNFDVGTALALLYLALQVLGALTGLLLQNRLLTLLDKLCPPSVEERLFEPVYIYPEAAQNPDTALILATREQDRLLTALAEYLDPVRQETPEVVMSVPLALRHAAACHLIEKIRAFLESALVNNHANSAIDPIFLSQSRNEIILALQESLRGFVDILQTIDPPNREWAAPMIEGLHLILMILRDTLQDDSDDPELLFALTQDRSQLMENVRNTLLSKDFSSITEKQALFVSTSTFERIIWLIRQLAASRFSEYKMT